MDDLYSYARHLGFDEHIAMDAIHDVFYKLCTNESTLSNVLNVKFYLFRSLKNRLIDIQRSHKGYSEAKVIKKEDFEEMTFHFNINIEDELIDKEEQEEIRKKVESVLSSLNNHQREIIYLRYIHEYDYAEIAELMHISVAACRNLISKSLNKLKKSSIPLTQLLLIISTSAFTCIKN